MNTRVDGGGGGGGGQIEGEKKEAHTRTYYLVTVWLFGFWFFPSSESIDVLEQEAESLCSVSRLTLLLPKAGSE